MPANGKKRGAAYSRLLERISRADPRLIETALQLLLSQKQLLEVIFENLQEGLVVTDPNLRVMACNPRACRWLGIPPRRRLTGESLLPLITIPEIFKFVTQTDFAKGGRVEQDFHLARFGGICLQLTSYPVIEDGAISSVVFVLRDVTDDRRAETQQHQAERIASLATLTAGVAHELKNPLNSLQIHAQLTNRMIDLVRESAATVDLDSLEASLHAILEETSRMSRIVDDFLCAVRPTNPEKSEVRLHELLTEVAGLFGRECEEKQIKLDVSCDTDIPPVLLDQHQIANALVNIIRNAVEAIETQRERLKAEGKRLKGESAQGGEDSIVITCRIEGDDALIQLADTGCGIEPEHLSKVFEPYFTTKFSGTGLGLMNVYRIVREHGGSVEIQSAPGGERRGTRVRLRLPLSQRPVRLLAEETEDSPSTPTPDVADGETESPDR
ncbi:PAS domain-containing protein [Candidatus Sumerlaeota bacterium]|nr:PAS domain-containing protein [Candidatus Sumerlaeota bacterium]